MSVLRFRHVIALACVVLALWLPAGRAGAGPAPTPSYAPPSAPAGVLTDVADLEGFLDGVIAQQLSDYHIPGAT